MTKKLMLKQLASMLASFKRKKKYYCEVEYLENTETGSTRNWINTEILADPLTTKWEVRVAFNDTGTGKLMGSGYSGSTRFNLGIESSKFRFGFATSWFDANASVSTPDTNPHTWSLDATTKTGTIDGYSATSTAEFGVERYPIALFGRANGATSTESSNTVVGKIYYTKIWQNNVLVRDMIPVLDWSYVPCMYDKVSGELFYNAGTGTFSYGREIHYVDYLESTGTQYINTGIYLTSNHSVEIDYQLTSTDLSTQARKGLYGGLVTSRHGALLSPTNRYLEAGYGEGNSYYQLGMPDTNRHVLYQKKNELYFDGALTYTFAAATFTQASTAPLGNFDYTNYAPAYSKYYSSRWWDGNTLVRDYKPAIDENGICFWFDKVSHNIFDNAGTGVFSYSAREVEYLESDGNQYIDTGITINTSTDEVISDFQLMSTTVYQWLMGEHDDGARFGIGVGDGTDKRNIAYGVTTYKVRDAQVYNEKHNFKANSNGVFLDDVRIHGYENFASTSTVYLFKLNLSGASGAAGKIWHYKHKRNGTLIRDFIPCYKDGVLGMWDNANNVFYNNAGTNTFITGKIKESEYLE